MQIPLLKSLPRAALILLALVAGTPARGDAASRPDVTVHAAASLTGALGEIVQAYKKDRAVDVKLSFASSGTLARQIDAGAPADIFVSADAKWMDYLQQRNRIDAASRTDLLGNRLVLVAPAGRTLPPIRLEKTFDLPTTLGGKLCTGETTSVPVGIYARAALTALGWWSDLQNRVVGTEDVRAALALVERGECAGIVYRTDALASRKVTLVAEFPADTHTPIRYPAALVAGAAPAAADFFRFLRSAAAREVFVRYGFAPLATE